jgi:hypothetical protein
VNDKKELIDTINICLFDALVNLHTSTVCRVEKVNQKTIDVKPVVNFVVKGRSIEKTTFTKVIPLFMKGGSSYTAHPISVGDYALVHFTERCMDRWYSGQDFVEPAEFRMHDYSDGFAVVGLENLDGAIDIPSVIQQTGDFNQDGNCTHQGNTAHTGSYTLNGNMDADTYSVDGTSGVSGTFLSDDGKSITVTQGLITAIT